MVEIPSVRKPDMALHRTLVYVASLSGYDRLFRVAMDVLSSWSAGEFGRWAAERPPRAQARRVTRQRTAIHRHTQEGNVWFDGWGALQ